MHGSARAVGADVAVDWRWALGMVKRVCTTSHWTVLGGHQRLHGGDRAQPEPWVRVWQPRHELLQARQTRSSRGGLCALDRGLDARYPGLHRQQLLARQEVRSLDWPLDGWVGLDRDIDAITATLMQRNVFLDDWQVCRRYSRIQSSIINPIINPIQSNPISNPIQSNQQSNPIQSSIQSNHQLNPIQSNPMQSNR